MPKQPINRHKALQPMSRGHHHGLLVGWKIRAGIRLGISPERIYKYMLWFFENYQLPHFQEEETFLFPILGNDHALVKKAVETHLVIKEFFKKEEVTAAELIELDKITTAHIRFEERELFNLIQESAGEDDLEVIGKHLEDHEFIENTEDEFWLPIQKP